jgi:hypothetical protein
MKLLMLLSIVLVAGCTPTQVVKTGKALHSAGCIVVTKETRAEIRSNQKIKTNICLDDIE